MDDLLGASARSLAALIREKRVSSLEVVEAHLQRIEEVNGSLNAVVQVTGEKARGEAREADAALARDRIKGPLHGVPFTVKDWLETAGVVCTAGLKNRSAYVPLTDATVVARMVSAGAILLGKTNVPGPGNGAETGNSVYGWTRNPYNLSHTPGGSSGGEAAIIAAEGSPVGLGSDSGGSIRLPAHYCGIAGLKPTTGRVPSTGHFPKIGGLNDPRSQIGPMSRFVEDLALTLEIISGVDWRDASVIPMPVGDPRAVETRGLRAAFYTDDGIMPPTPETIDTVRATIDALSDADVGLVVEEDRPRQLEESLDITRRYWQHGGMQGRELDRLMADWERFRTTMLSFVAEYDAIICPVSHSPAVPCGTMERDTAFTYTLPYSLTGWPAVVVRAGTSTEGLPINVQIVARPWREDVALAVAQHVEDQLGGWQRP